MAITVNHSTPADGSFSTTGAAAWDANHSLTGIGTMAEQNANNVTITGGTITGITIGTATNISGGLANQLLYQSASGTTTFLTAPTIAGTYLNWSGSAFQWSPNPLGDVVGPASATDNAIARFDTTTGKLIQNSVVTIDDAGNEAGINSINFDTTPTTVPTTPGSLYWDSANGNQTLSLVMANGDAVQQIGEETYFRIRASAAITEGQVVMFTGTIGGSGALTGAPASGLTATTASYVMGIATHNLAINEWGYITSFGLVRGIDTTGGAEAWVDGQILYYNPAVAGGLTKTVPVAPNAKIQICAVVNAASSGSGSVFVRPTFGGALGQYEGDVQVTTPANGDLLIRNQTTGEWVNAPLTAGTAISVTNTAGAVSIANTAPDQTVVLTAGTGISTSGTYPNFTITNTLPSLGGTVTSVAATVPSFLSVSGSPITTSGTLALTYSGTALPVANGGTGITTTPTNGQIPIGNGTNYTAAALTAGTNIAITNGSGSISVATNIPVPQIAVYSTASSSGTYTTPANCRYLVVRLVGGGAGGAGGNTASAGGAGGNGTSTTFGSLTGTGASGASCGTGSGGDINISGGTGGYPITSGSQTVGAFGGNSAFGGAGASIGYGNNGLPGAANSGSGGGGGCGAEGFVGGTSGGAGGYVEKLITSPSATYSYAVGAGGAGGAAGGAGAGAGGAGGSGIIIVTAYF